MSINKAIVVGNLGRDPEVRALPSGQNVANFSLATTERFTDRSGSKQQRTEWHLRGRIRTACGYVPTVLEPGQRPSGLRRLRSAHYPPVRSEEGRKRQTLPD